MTRFSVAGLLVVAGCSMQDAGIVDMAPAVWTAWADCHPGISVMSAGEVTELEDGWSCQPKASRYEDDGLESESIHCWRGDAEIWLQMVCQANTTQTAVQLAGCQVRLSCDSNGVAIISAADQSR